MTRAIVASTLFLAGCFHAPPPVARVHHGPAYGQVVDPVAALPVTCTSTGPMGCAPEHTRAVAIATRMALEFAGYALVDSELLNAETRRRRSTVVGEVTTAVEKSGPNFEALTPSEQRELLFSMGVHGVLAAEINLAPPHGAAMQRTVTVTVTVRRLSDDAIAWRSKCSAESGDYNAPERALDLAARCALESPSLW